MARRRHSGATLAELLIALAIAGLLAAPLAATIRSALAAQAVANETNDVAQQARFAMQRVVAAVQRTAPHPLSSKPASTTADWLGAVAFCRNGSAQLVETVPADAGCSGTRAIADQVSAFSVQTYAAGAAAAPVIEIQLTLTGTRGKSIALTSRTRLGGGVL